MEFTDRVLQLRLNELVNRGVGAAAAVIVTRQSEKVYTIRLPGAPAWVGGGGGHGGWGGAAACTLQHALATGGGWGPTPKWDDRAKAQAAAAAAEEEKEEVPEVEVEAREVRPDGGLLPRQLTELDEEELRAEVRHLTTVLAAGASLLQEISRPPPSRADDAGFQRHARLRRQP